MNPSAFPTAPTAPATGKRGPEAETKQNHAPSHTTITISKGGIFSWPTGGKVGWPLTAFGTIAGGCARHARYHRIGSPPDLYPRRGTGTRERSATPAGGDSSPPSPAP